MTEERNIADILAEVAENAEQTRDQFTKLYRSKQPPTDPSQVYSIRIPVSRLGKIRHLAARYKMPPTSMLRQWILERLDLEEQSIGVAQESHVPVNRPTVAVFYTRQMHVFEHSDAGVVERELRMGGIHARMAGV